MDRELPILNRSLQKGTVHMNDAHIPRQLFVLTILLALNSFVASPGQSQTRGFRLTDTTVQEVHDAYKSQRLTAHQLVQLYLNRIEAYDKKGPGLNSIITINPRALQEADELDAAFKTSGLTGPLHGIPVIIKDQMDAKGMPTTLGSILFKNYFPDRDSFVAEKLRKAGAIILAKTTLGELGGGDTHGSLFGSTRNPYALDRTPGGSSGGSGAGISANFATVAVGQEGFASIRRPATWNCVVGIRPTAGLISRSGVFDGWPEINGSLGPITRTVTDAARLMDVMVGYDPEDSLTAAGVGHVSGSYTKFLDKNGLRGARIGVLREPMGRYSEPQSQDFAKITAVFNDAMQELKAAGAILVDPIAIPNLNELLNTRAEGPTERADAFQSVRQPQRSSAVPDPRGNDPLARFRQCCQICDRRKASNLGRCQALPLPSSAAGTYA
jgi:Asp-tRNA(Asn)/Glu-tRNA(Gln) amidotransferase A subunit family amidase